MLTHRQMWNYNSHSHVYQMWLRITNQIYPVLLLRFKLISGVGGQRERCDSRTQLALPVCDYRHIQYCVSSSLSRIHRERPVCSEHTTSFPPGVLRWHLGQCLWSFHTSAQPNFHFTPAMILYPSLFSHIPGKTQKRIQCFPSLPTIWDTPILLLDTDSIKQENSSW